jgi:hypothetical protein
MGFLLRPTFRHGYPPYNLDFWTLHHVAPSLYDYEKARAGERGRGRRAQSCLRTCSRYARADEQFCERRRRRRVCVHRSQTTSTNHERPPRRGHLVHYPVASQRGKRSAMEYHNLDQEPQAIYHCNGRMHCGNGIQRGLSTTNYHVSPPVTR